MLSDILSRLVETVAEQGEDMQVRNNASAPQKIFPSPILTEIRSSQLNKPLSKKFIKSDSSNLMFVAGICYRAFTHT